MNLHDPVMHIQHLPEVIEHSNADIYAIVRVRDPDPAPHGDVASVEIIEGDNDAHFRVRRSAADPKEFNVEVVRLLDREVSPYGYNLTLKAVSWMKWVDEHCADDNINLVKTDDDILIDAFR